MQTLGKRRPKSSSLFAHSSRAELVFSCDPAGHTYLSRQFVQYPFHVCRPTQVESDPPGMATLYLQSCSGGLLQHDDLTMSLTLEEDAQVHLTTGAPTIVHSMDESQAKQRIRVEAKARSFAEYLPEALILFPRARLSSSLLIVAHPTSSVIAGESFLVHDYCGHGRMFHWLDSELVVARPNGQLLARDRFLLHGDVLQMGMPGLNGPYMAQGSLVMLCHDEDAERLLDHVREALDHIEGTYSGASTLRGRCGVWVRVLAADGLALHKAMVAAWSAGRMVLVGHIPSPRRK